MMSDEMRRARETWLWDLARSLGVARDLRLEANARSYGRELARDAAGLDGPGWERHVSRFRDMGPMERIIVWHEVTTASPYVFRNVFRTGEEAERLRCKAAYDEFMARAKAAHRHLGPLVLESLTLARGPVPPKTPEGTPSDG